MKDFQRRLERVFGQAFNDDESQALGQLWATSTTSSDETVEPTVSGSTFVRDFLRMGSKLRRDLHRRRQSRSLASLPSARTTILHQKRPISPTTTSEDPTSAAIVSSTLDKLAKAYHTNPSLSSELQGSFDRQNLGSFLKRILNVQLSSSEVDALAR